jgi:hypothetical protein
MLIFLFAGKKKDGSEKHGAWCHAFAPSIRPKRKQSLFEIGKYLINMFTFVREINDYVRIEITD